MTLHYFIEDGTTPRQLETVTDSSNAIIAVDKRGPGGANHKYVVTAGHQYLGYIKFQEGPIQEKGVNGLTQEDLLAVVIDRLQCFQFGAFACEENSRALKATKSALDWLRHRTANRKARGVEGISKK